MGFFGDLFGGDAEKEAAAKNRALYDQYNTFGTNALNTGLNQSTGALNSAKADYAPLSALAAKYGAGTDLYLDALGINGAAGNARAASAFTTAPGYQKGIDAGLDAINRRRASAGMVNSGNADIDALGFAQNAQNQQYGSWLTNLSGINNSGLTATGAVANGLAGVDTNLANLYQSDAQNRINLQGNVTSGNASANNLEAQGRASGAKNLLSAGMGLASLATSAFGGGGGLGSLGSAFGFGGGGSGVVGAGSYGGTPFLKVGSGWG